MKQFKRFVILLAFLLAAGCAAQQAGAPVSQAISQVSHAVPPSSPTAETSLVPTSTYLPSTPGEVISASTADTPPLTLPSPTGTAQAVSQPGTTASPASHSTPTPTLAPDAWKSMPVIPQVSETARQIYQRGLAMGNDPHAFSKIGDCGSTPSWFLGDFDHGPKYYSLGSHQDLAAVIQQFQGSFDRTSLAARSGFNASSVFAPIWADRSQCSANETPLACEYRIHRPSIAFIMLGTNDVWHKDVFETQMRKIIEYSIDHGVLPILATKADNDEGDGSINATIARLAVEYDIPLWNFWLAVQPLPKHGLQPDQAHITWGPNRFDDPQAMTKGWTIRNLTALQALNTVWQGVTGKDVNQP